LSRRKRRSPSRSRGWVYAIVAAVAVVAIIVGYFLFTLPHPNASSIVTTTSASTQISDIEIVSVSSSKPVILYVNQGNGAVNQSNFGALLTTATSHGFNTIFFQVYRSGTLLFTNDELSQFVSSAHSQGLKIFFALYFTDMTQDIPTSIYSYGEDGISLDMSALPLNTQTALFNALSSGYSGKTAITTLDPTLPLTPDLLVVETYAPSDQQYIHHGMIASVEVVATSGRSDYKSQVEYALDHSDGVMVFDYHGLVKAGY
jgi:hypothetical protein